MKNRNGDVFSATLQIHERKTTQKRLNLPLSTGLPLLPSA
jgi:hypothetical protein